MLNENEIMEIDRELARCRNKRAGCIEALKTVQKHRGWISDDAIKELSAHLEMTPDELDGVATFYNLIFRKPVGRHVILICDSVVCWMTGGEILKKHLYDRLGIAPGETTADKRFTLIPNACLGTCDRAPALMIDDQLYTELTPERLDAILDSYK
jgi:NADH-quinone oxidoreductase subunit E